LFLHWTARPAKAFLREASKSRLETPNHANHKSDRQEWDFQDTLSERESGEFFLSSA
jgi:hypothetical protein